MFWHPTTGYLSSIAMSNLDDDDDGHDRSGSCRHSLLGICHGEPSTAIIPVEDWIYGLILHIAAMDHLVLPERKRLIGPKGVTILFKSGLKLELGVTSRRYLQKVLVSRPRSSLSGHIVGIMAQLSVEVSGDENYTTFTRLGLIQVDDIDLESRSLTMMPHRGTVELPRGEESRVDSLI